MRALPLHLASLLLLSLAAACGPAEVLTEDLSADADALTRAGRFETFTGRDGQAYFHLIAGNGEKVLHSEGYATASGALAGISSVRANGATAARYQVRTAVTGEAYLALTASNGQVIAMGERYASAANAERAVLAIVEVVKSATGPFDALASGGKLELFRGLDGQYYFHLRALNGEIVLRSEGYTTRTGATNGIASVKTNGALADRYKLVDHADGSAHFVLRAANYQVIAVSETYASRSNAQRGIDACLELLAAGTGAGAPAP